MTCRTCPVMRLCCHRLRSSPSSYSSYQVPSFSPCKMLIIQPILKTRVSWSLEMASVQFSHSLISDSLRLHGLQDPKLPFPSRTPRACSNSCALSRWCHPTISSSVSPFSSCLQSFPASGSFLMSQLFTSGGQSIGASASASVLPKNIQDWFPLGFTGLILLSKGLSRAFSNTTVQKNLFLVLSFLYGPTFIFIHDYWKNHSFD